VTTTTRYPIIGQRCKNPSSNILPLLCTENKVNKEAKERKGKKARGKLSIFVSLEPIVNEMFDVEYIKYISKQDIF